MNVAGADDRIRTVLLSGSRANPDIKPDIFQDFDIVYIVRDIESFLSDHSWTDVFGKRIIMQMPEGMTVENDDTESISFSYLMLFDDGNRIDLTLFPAELYKGNMKPDSLSKVLLNKDKKNVLTDLPESNDSDYHIKKPSEKMFSDCCNEFRWVSTYAAKALWRNEIIYAKYILDNPVRKMFMLMIEWFIGTESNFSVSFGKCGRNVKKFVSPELYKRILETYADSDIENVWRSLFNMSAIFSELAVRTSSSLYFKYDLIEDEKVNRYLKHVHTMTKENPASE